MERETVETLKSLLRTGQLEKVIQILFEIMQCTTEKLKNNFTKNSGQIEDFNEITKVIYQAIECKDVVLLCDMIEYELYPFIKENIT